SDDPPRPHRNRAVPGAVPRLRRFLMGDAGGGAASGVLGPARPGRASAGGARCQRMPARPIVAVRGAAPGAGPCACAPRGSGRAEGRKASQRRDAAWRREARLRDILAALDGQGEEARVVGGAVRNALLGEPHGDTDIATTALPSEVIRRVETAGFKAVPTG